ncbi:MAG: signal peptidase I [Trueperaceae bacterium]
MIPDGGRKVNGPARKLGRTVLESLVAAALLVTFVMSGVAISGDSMEPTLHDGERALVPRFETWLHRLGVGSFGRGDIVYFPSPDSGPGAICPWFCTHLIKRIVAVGGDRVAIARGQLILNGEPLDEAYLQEQWHGSFSMPETPIPPGHVFVLGDNRGPYGSFDSRVFGALPRRQIEGRAALVVWPLFTRDDEGRWQWNVRRLKPSDYGSVAASRPSSSRIAARSCIAASTNST